LILEYSQFKMLINIKLLLLNFKIISIFRSYVVSQNHIDTIGHVQMYKNNTCNTSNLASSHRPSVSASRSYLNTASSPRLSFKTSRDRSMSSLLSLGTGQRTPKMARKNHQNQAEKTVKFGYINLYFVNIFFKLKLKNN
jgi:hypothetical protein